MNYKRYYKKCVDFCENELKVPVKNSYRFAYIIGSCFFGQEITVIEEAEDIAKIVGLFHEQTHAEHDKNGCNCIRTNNHALAEYHAIRGTLEKAHKTQDKKIIEAAINRVDEYIEQKIRGYITAAKRCKKLKIYKKCINFVKNT